MHIRRAVLIFLAGIITASCSEKLAPDRDKDTSEGRRESRGEAAEAGAVRQPDEDKIAEDCAALVRSTKLVPAQGANRDCPACPAGASEALSFRQVKTNAISCSGETCTVLVTIRAVFNPAAGETIAGGLTAWLPPEQRRAYLSGETPAGEQEYPVQISYKRRSEGWRVIDFDRPSGG